MALHVFLLVQPRERGANYWRNDADNVRRRWQRGEPIDDGRQARCSLTPCHRFPLESQGNQAQLWCYVTGRWVKVLAEALNGASLQDEVPYPD